MSSLQFQVIDAHPEPFAATPQLALRMRITESTGAHIYAIALRAQIMLEPQRRRYEAAESRGLEELFGSPDRYADTLRPMLWTHVSQMVLAFSDSTQFELSIPCSYDFEVAASKYLSALENGDIPLSLLFSGTVLTRGDGGISAERVPWTAETRFRLPVSVWRATMDAFFPNSAWLRLERNTFNDLRDYKAARGWIGWDQTIARLLEAAKVSG